MRAELSKAFFVEAAHRVPGGREGCSRLHGHSLKVEVVVEGEVSSDLGWLLDYGEITERFKPVYDQIDHSCLNDVEGLEDPSPEGLAAWLKNRLASRIPCLKDVRVSIVGQNKYEVSELSADRAHDLPRRLYFTFEAAQSLSQLPPGHKCRQLHGHSYRVEVGASDLGRLKAHLPGLYEALDHRYLNEVPGLENATCERICQWMWERLSEEVDDLAVIVVQETNSARCTYYGG